MTANSTNAPATESLMDRVKAATWELHQAAEGKALQKKLASGTITREEYAGWLAQMRHVHAALERAIRDARPNCAALGVVTDEQLGHSVRIDADLRALGHDTEVPAVASARALCDTIAGASAENPVALLGYHYVLEGSMNGNRFIARGVRGALCLEGSDGVRYLDPYGEEQRDKWRAFRVTVDALGLSEQEEAVVTDAATGMFRTIGEMSDELAGVQTA